MALLRDPADRRFRHYCETGDPGALGDVFDRTAGKLMRVALWLTGNRADAEDLLQRTFLKAIEIRAQFRPGSPVLPWLMGLLGNEGRRLRRDRDRLAALRPQPERVVDPAAAVVANELAETVRSVGERLGGPYGDVLRLHLEAGLNCNEIAAKLGRPAGSVRTQLMRGLELLRRLLPSGFAAGFGVAATGDLSLVRATVVSTAKGAMPSSAVAGSTAMTVFGALTMTKMMPVLIPAAIAIVGAVALVLSRSDAAPLSDANTSGIAVTDRERPAANGTSVRQPARVEVSARAIDPLAVTLPQLRVLGELSEDGGRAVLTADGKRELPAGTNPDVRLFVDRAARYRELVGLLVELWQNGTRRVHFACTTPSGDLGAFTLALPANDTASPAFTMRLHHGRTAVPATSVVPVLERIVRGGRMAVDATRSEGRAEGRASYSLGIRAPDDAAFGAVLPFVAATCRAGVDSVMLVRNAEAAPADGAQPIGAGFAIDLGPAPLVAVGAHFVPVLPVDVRDVAVGFVVAPNAPAPDHEVGRAGGRYGGRGRKRRSDPEDPEAWSVDLAVAAGLSWLERMQQPDGSLLDDASGPDVAATALTMLALLANGTTLYGGSRQQALAKGIGWLLDQQRDDGLIGPAGPNALTAHALAAHALGEAYGLSQCFEVRAGLVDAVAFLAAQRQADGGFPAGVPGLGSEVQATALAVMVSATCEFFGNPHASHEVAFRGKDIVRWFDPLETERSPCEAAAEGFVRIFTQPSVKALPAFAAKMAGLQDAADVDDPWSMYWASHTLLQLKPNAWRRWLARVEEVGRTQQRAGDAAGSYPSAGGLPGVVTTALRVLALQSASRYGRLIR